MTVSSQIIEVLNDLCNKFGIAIDWSEKNVLPVLEELAGRYVQYEIMTSFAWILIACSITLLFGFIMYLSYSKHWHKTDQNVCVAMFGVVCCISIFVVCTQVFDIIEGNIIPEKTVFEYVKFLLQTSG